MLNGSTFGSRAACKITSDGHITDGKGPECDCGVLQDGGGCWAAACEVWECPAIDWSWHYYDAETIAKYAGLLAPPLTRVKVSPKKDAIARASFMLVLEVWGDKVGGPRCE